MNALMEHQVKLEQLFNKNQLIPRIKQEFMDSPEFAKHMEMHNIPIPFGFDLLVQMALHKRTDLPTMIGLTRHHFNDSQVTADMILRACEVDLVDWDSVTRKLIVKFLISDDVQEELDRFQYPLPMVVPPKEIKSNSDNGYMMSRGSVILRKNHHNDDVCLDHLNRVNAIKFTINKTTALMVKNEWRNLDKPKPGEKKEDFQRRKKAFEKYDRTAKAVIDLLQELSDDFYLTHKYDKRGRIYCQGYHVNYQGAPWNKAVIELADKEMIND